MVKNMRPGSVVLDMAVEFGGNCEVSESNKIVVKHEVTLIGETNLPSLVPFHSSEMYAKNLQNLIEYFSKEGNFNFNLEDEILKGATITKDGAVFNERTKELIK